MFDSVSAVSELVSVSGVTSSDYRLEGLYMCLYIERDICMHIYIYSLFCLGGGQRAMDAFND